MKKTYELSEELKKKKEQPYKKSDWLISPQHGRETKLKIIDSTLKNLHK
jgi:hypothetical protein